MWWSKQQKNRSAIVLSGGGTRGAYEAGVIKYIRTQIPLALSKKLQFDIHVGSSVGAINAAYMVGTAQDLSLQGRKLVELWKNIRTENVYRRGPVTLSKLLIGGFMSGTTHILGIKGLKSPEDSTLEFRALFDTEPFQKYLKENCPIQEVSKNLESGLVQALAVPATNLHTGKIEIFVQKNAEMMIQGDHRFQLGRINLRHIMASAALPVLFPPVPINNVHYNDGGLRLKTPLNPAVHLGANKIMIIGTRSRDPIGPPPSKPENPPSLGEIMGKMFAALFLDRLDADQAQLEKVNKILARIETEVSARAFEKICEETNARPIQTLSISPSVDIAKLVDDQLRTSYRNLKTMGTLERAILRLLEIDVEKGSDLLSYFLFEPSYINELIELGYKDAKNQHDEICTFAESL